MEKSNGLTFIGHTGAVVKCQKCGEEYYEPCNVSLELICPNCVAKEQGKESIDTQIFSKMGI